MGILDVFIVFVATPSISADLGASDTQIEWTVAGYGLAFALALITGGRVGDMFGHRRAFQAGLGLFTLASGLCAASPTPVALIAARVLQGGGAALMLPQVLSIIQLTFGAGERARALAVMGAVQGAAAVGGQLIGGALIEFDAFGLGWRWVFLVNLPIGLATIAAAQRLIPDSGGGPDRRFDPLGIVLGLLAVAGVCVPLVEGREAGWAPWTFASVATAGLVVWAFIRWERRVIDVGGYPLVVLDLFQLRTFRIGVLVSLLLYMGLPSLFLSLAIYFQQGLELSPLASGVAFLPLAVGFTAASLTCSALSVENREATLPIAALVVAIAVTLMAALLASGAGASALTLAPIGFAIGAGQGFTIPGLNGTVLAETPAASAGSASGLLATAQQIGGALGVAVGGTLLFGILGDAPDAEAYADALAGVASFVAAIMLVGAVLCRRLLVGRPVTDGTESSSP